MKNYFILLFSLFAALNVFATSASENSALVLIKKMRSGFYQTEKAPLLKFMSVPEEPKQGQPVKIYIQSETTFKNKTIILDAKLDGTDVTLVRGSEKIWVFSAGSFATTGLRTLSVKVSVEDKNLANEIRKTLETLNSEVAVLNRKIAVETDPVKKDELIAEKARKQAIISDLTNELARIKNHLANEIYKFTILSNTTDADFPTLISVSPSSGPQTGGTSTTLMGTNFSSPFVVKFGTSTAASSTLISGDQITAVTPALTEGLHDVTVEMPPLAGSTEPRVAMLKNAFFALPPTAPPRNEKPVAVLEGSQQYLLGEVAELNASGSYDVNEDSIEYFYKFLSVPEGSIIPVGSELPNQVQVQFTPDRAGVYVVELRVRETSTADKLISDSSLAVVKVLGSPVIRANKIVTESGVTGQAQVFVSNPNSGLSLDYEIAVEPAHGSAHISPAGLISYTSESGFVGLDSFTARVTDQAGLSGTVVIPVEVKPYTNKVPAITFEEHLIKNQGFPVTVRFFATGNDPDGNIKEWILDFGDGTPVQKSTNTGQFFAANAFHDYVEPGAYTAKITATDNNNASTTYNFTVNVVNKPVPVAKFTSSVGGGPAPLTVQFNAGASTSADGAIVKYTWLWGSGSQNIEVGTATMTHTFTTPGIYKVGLLVEDENKGESEASMFIYVGVPIPPGGREPSAHVLALPGREVVVATPVSFDASGSFPVSATGTLVSYDWSFADYDTCSANGCTASGITATHTYNLAQNTFPRVAVTNAAGKQGFGFTEMWIVNQGHAPRAVVDISAESGVAPLTVNVNAQKSYDTDLGSISFEWNFIDDPVDCPVIPGCVSTAPATSFTYTDPGVYLLLLKVVDNDGNISNWGRFITVEPDVKSKFKKYKKTTTDPLREQQKHMLSGACGRNDAVACYYLAEMFTEDGNAFGAQKLLQKSCGLGYVPACQK